MLKEIHFFQETGALTQQGAKILKAYLEIKDVRFFCFQIFFVSNFFPILTHHANTSKGKSVSIYEPPLFQWLPR